MTQKRLAGVLLTAALALPACGGTSAAAKKAPEARPEFSDEHADPYRFQRSIANALLRTGQPQEASGVIRRMIAMRPEKVEPYYLLGRAFVDMGQYEPAQRTLAAAIERDPKYAPAHAMLGVLLDTIGRSEEAEQSHQRALKLAPDEADYRNNLGFNLYLRGKYAQSILRFREALELDPAAHRIHNNLAFAYAKLGRLEQAENHFKLGGPPAQASNNMGFVYEERGQSDLAYQHFLVAVNQDPLLLPARDNLKNLCARLGRPMPELHASRAPLEAQEPTVLAPPTPTPASTEGKP